MRQKKLENGKEREKSGEMKVQRRQLKEEVIIIKKKMYDNG